MARSRSAAAYASLAATTFLFSGLTEEETEELLGHPEAFVQSYARGERIRTEHGASRALGILLSGGAVVEKHAGSSVMRMSVLRPGDLFGAASIFCEAEDYVAQIVADGHTRALILPETALLSMMHRDQRVMENYIRYLTARIRFLSARIDGFVCGGSEERVLLFLSNNAEQGVCTLPYGMETFARTLSMSRATLYRALDALADAGRIRRNGRSFTILTD